MYMKQSRTGGLESTLEWSSPPGTERPRVRVLVRARFLPLFFYKIYFLIDMIRKIISRLTLRTLRNKSCNFYGNGSLHQLACGAIKLIEVLR